jgi:hypothetical protein
MAVRLPPVRERAAAVREGAGKIWAQDAPVNKAMQSDKRSRFMPKGCYGPLETTLVQFNAWLLRRPTSDVISHAAGSLARQPIETNLDVRAAAASRMRVIATLVLTTLAEKFARLTLLMRW